MAIDIIHQVVGLPEAEAVERLKKVGLRTRVVERDGTSFPRKADAPWNRVSLTIRDGIVKKAERG